MPYLNVDEVESAIELVADSNPGLTELIELPRSTWEGRTSRAIRVHKGGAIAEGIYLLGGVHAREWGSSDILISFVQRITDAYRTGTGITLGGKTFSAPDIGGIVETLEVVVFPQVNPDGRRYSKSVAGLRRRWRQRAGRRPQPQLRLPLGFPDKIQSGRPGDDIHRPVQRDLPWPRGLLRARDTERHMVARPAPCGRLLHRHPLIR